MGTIDIHNLQAPQLRFAVQAGIRFYPTSRHNVGDRNGESLFRPSKPASFKKISIGSSKPFRTDVKEAIKKKRPFYQMLSASASSQINFPLDYAELVVQVQAATMEALKDSKLLLEIEFPTAGLDSVSGDAEGGIEMSSSMVLIKEFCGLFNINNQAGCTRIFFPDATEVESARKNVFEGTSFKLDYLTRPSGLEDIGFGTRVKMAERVHPNDKIFVIAYPYFNVNEILAVEELYKDAAQVSGRPLIVFNGELDRIRSGYYPSFFYPKLGALGKNFLPNFETVYYIHNFKGRFGGTLFRSYPGPWQVLRKDNNNYVCIHEQETMPSLKEVALNILPAS